MGGWAGGQRGAGERWAWMVGDVCRSLKDRGQGKGILVRPVSAHAYKQDKHTVIIPLYFFNLL